MVLPQESAGAGAPDLTPEMIAAGIEFMEDEALNTVSTRVMTPEFIQAFYKAIMAARPASFCVRHPLAVIDPVNKKEPPSMTAKLDRYDELLDLSSTLVASPKSSWLRLGIQKLLLLMNPGNGHCSGCNRLIYRKEYRE